jgi:aromatic-L-amino-acid/L-tryptophan decarboxylase
MYADGMEASTGETTATGSLVSLDPEHFRRLGYQVIDAIAERMAVLAGEPVGSALSSESHLRITSPIPEVGLGSDPVLKTVLSDVIASGLRIDHPRFFAYVPSPSNPVGVLADIVAAGFNVFAGTWQAAPGAALVEVEVIEWLRHVCGLPENTSGLFVSGGSMANLVALAVSLHELGDDRSRSVVYLSDQTHSSVTRALRILGVADERIRILPSDSLHRLDPALLNAAIKADRDLDLIPACVVATAGSTSTGAIDPLADLAAACRREQLWLHVDAAIAGAVMLCDEMRPLLDGIEHADSVTLDAHKWFFQPLEAGCLLVRNSEALERLFRMSPAYLRDATTLREEVNFADRGPQLTRHFRALKLWMSLQVYGVSEFRSAVRNGLSLARHVEDYLRAGDQWEVMTPAQCGIVTFRATVPGASDAALDLLNAALPAALLQTGFAYVSTTEVRGRTVLRLCTINPRTTIYDVRQTIDRLEELVAAVVGEPD